MMWNDLVARRSTSSTASCRPSTACWWRRPPVECLSRPESGPDQRQGQGNARLRGTVDRSGAAESRLRPASVDAVVVSHLHFDHAGGVLQADGGLAFPGRASWPSWRNGNRHGRQRATRGRLRPAGTAARARSRAGRHRGGRGRDSAGRQRHTDRRPLGRSSGRADPWQRRDDRLPRRPVHAAWSANPRWVTAFDDFPLDSVLVKASLFARASAEGWTIVLSHEPFHPVGRLVRDRDRYHFEASV